VRRALATIQAASQFSGLDGHWAVGVVLRSTVSFKAPAPRRRSSRVLSLVEREEISRGIAAGYTIRAIARGLNRAASTVSQEVLRHGGRQRYRASRAKLAAWLVAQSLAYSPGTGRCNGS
jgi:DNA-binding CsgD family transcriptional regulator